jgi:hypothetical protein
MVIVPTVVSKAAGTAGHSVLVQSVRLLVNQAMNKGTIIDIEIGIAMSASRGNNSPMSETAEMRSRNIGNFE